MCARSAHLPWCGLKFEEPKRGDSVRPSGRPPGRHSAARASLPVRLGCSRLGLPASRYSLPAAGACGTGKCVSWWSGHFGQRLCASISGRVSWSRAFSRLVSVVVGSRFWFRFDGLDWSVSGRAEAAGGSDADAREADRFGREAALAKSPEFLLTGRPNGRLTREADPGCSAAQCRIDTRRSPWTGTSP